MAKCSIEITLSTVTTFLPALSQSQRLDDDEWLGRAQIWMTAINLRTVFLAGMMDRSSSQTSDI
jgi:hypothetical protein